MRKLLARLQGSEDLTLRREALPFGWFAAHVLAMLAGRRSKRWAVEAEVVCFFFRPLVNAVVVLSELGQSA